MVGDDGEPEAPQPTAKPSTTEIQIEVKLLERLVAIASITGALIAILGAVIAGRQYVLARDTAQSQTRLQEEAVRLTTLSTRPWIRSTSIIGKDDQGAKNVIIVGYRNSGHTPTVIMPIVYGQFFRAPVMPEELSKHLNFDVDLSVTQTTGAAIMIVPADSESQDAIRIPKQFLHASDIDDVDGKRGLKDQASIAKELATHVLYVWGAVLYADGLHQEHQVKFCYEHRPGDGQMYACPIMNILDEPIFPSDADCVTPQSGRAAPVTHVAPCKQYSYQ